MAIALRPGQLVTEPLLVGAAVRQVGEGVVATVMGLFGEQRGV